MKTLISFLVVLFIGSSSLTFAQKVQKEGVGDYKYVQLPSKITLVDFKTYNVDAKGMNDDAYRRDAIRSQISLAGYDKLSARAEADFVVEVEEYPLRFSDAEKKSKTTTTKVDGVEKKSTSYWYVSKCNFKYVLRVFDKAGAQMFADELAGEDAITGGQDGSSSTAWENYKTAINNYRSSVISDKVSSLNGRINNKYCFPVKSEYIVAGKVKPKKHDYSDINGVLDVFKAGFEIVKADENAIEEAAVKLDEAISIYKKVLEESDIENKKARINKDVTAALYYNIAISCYLLKDYPMAIENFNKAIEVKSGIFDAKIMLSRSKNLQKRTEINSAS